MRITEAFDVNVNGLLFTVEKALPCSKGGMEVLLGDLLQGLELAKER